MINLQLKQLRSFFLFLSLTHKPKHSFTYTLVLLSPIQITAKQTLVRSPSNECVFVWSKRNQTIASKHKRSHAYDGWLWTRQPAIMTKQVKFYSKYVTTHSNQTWYRSHDTHTPMRAINSRHSMVSYTMIAPRALRKKSKEFSSTNNRTRGDAEWTSDHQWTMDMHNKVQCQQTRLCLAFFFLRRNEKQSSLHRLRSAV